MSRSSDGFASAVEGFEGTERVAFVAAVYEARGWETERADTAVLVRPPGDGSDRRRVLPPGGDGGSDAPGATRLDAADLRRMVRYAVTPADRARLCRRFFDRSPAAMGLTGCADTASSDAGADTADAPESRADRVDGPALDGTDHLGDDTAVADGADADERGGRRRLVPAPTRSGVALAFVCVVAVVLFAVGPLAPAGERTGSAPAADPPGGANVSADVSVTPTDDGTATPNASPVAPDEPVENSAPGRAAVLEEWYPPGIDTGGVENASALAAAHRRALADQPYQLSITYRESVDGDPAAVAWERTTVATPGRHRSTVRVLGTFRWPPSGIANASTYANGTARVVRVGPNTDPDGRIRFERPPEPNGSAATTHLVVGPAPDTDPFAPRTASVLKRAVSGTETTLSGTFEHGDTRYLWIEFGDQSGATGTGAGCLIVDERGLVHEMHYSRSVVALDSTRVRRTVTLRITPGNVTTTTPPWYRLDDGSG